MLEFDIKEFIRRLHQDKKTEKLKSENLVKEWLKRLGGNLTTEQKRDFIYLISEWIETRCNGKISMLEVLTDALEKSYFRDNQNRENTFEEYLNQISENKGPYSIIKNFLAKSELDAIESKTGLESHLYETEMKAKIRAYLF